MSALASVVTTLTANERRNSRKGWRTKPHPQIERYMGIVVLLLRRPHAAVDLYAALGITHSSNNIQTVLDVMHEKGLVFIREWRATKGRAVPVYQWKHGTIGYDAPKPRPRGAS